MFMTNIFGSFPVSELWTHSHTVLTTISQVSTRRIYLWWSTDSSQRYFKSVARWAVAGVQIGKDRPGMQVMRSTEPSSFGTPNLVHWLLGTDADLSRCPTCVANMISSDAYWSYCGFTLVHQVLNITRELRVGLSCSISGLYISSI